MFGKPLRLTVQQTAARACQIETTTSDRLLMKVPEGSTKEQKARWLATWYREQLRDRAAARISRWAEQLGVPIPRWGIKVMRTKWGSCNPEKGLVWLNLDLAKKPLHALDYVILHEIAHLVSPRHDEVFMAVMDRNMPGWRQIRSDLNALPLSA